MNEWSGQHNTRIASSIQQLQRRKKHALPMLKGLSNSNQTNDKIALLNKKQWVEIIHFLHTLTLSVPHFFWLW